MTLWFILLVTPCRHEVVRGAVVSAGADAIDALQRASRNGIPLHGKAYVVDLDGEQLARWGPWVDVLLTAEQVARMGDNPVQLRLAASPEVRAQQEVWN